MIAISAVLAVAPKCPFCLAAWLGTFGLATVPDSVYSGWLAPVTAASLALTVALLAFRGGGPRRYGPALLGLLGGLAIIIGKFILDHQTLLYAGIAALLAAAVWRAGLSAPTPAELCGRCASTSRP
jgi:mercuric ion transport protein